MKPIFRIGQGYDVHRLVDNRELWLCGIKIPHSHGLLGHSDADVAIHALCDALLGAAAMRDIGYHFPDNDSKYSNIDSKILLKDVIELLRENNWKVGNVDITIIAQTPKLSPHIQNMRECLSGIMDIEIDCISVKATTTEHLGFEGESLGISSQAVAMIYKD